MPKDFEDMVKAIKKSLMDKNPEMTDKDAEGKARAMATTMWKKTHDGKMPSEKTDSSITESLDAHRLKAEKRDDKGRLIIAENIPIIINGTIGVVA